MEAGDFFRLLEQYSKINRTELSEIHRQQHEEYRHGIELASEGNVGAAFDYLDSHGFIHESEGKYLDEAAKSFLRLTEDGRRPLDCIAAAPTNKECEILTEKIREQMKSKGLMNPETEQQIETFRSWSWTKERIGDAKNYQPGMKLFFTTKIKGIGVPDLHLNQIRDFDIILPSYDKQNEFAAFIEELDKSKVTIQKSLDRLNLLYKALLQEYFG